MLPGCRYQRGVNDLTTAHEEALLEQLRGDAIKDGFGTGFANPVLKLPKSIILWLSPLKIVGYSSHLTMMLEYNNLAYAP